MLAKMPIGLLADTTTRDIQTPLCLTGRVMHSPAALTSAEVVAHAMWDHQASLSVCSKGKHSLHWSSLEWTCFRIPGQKTRCP